MRNGRDLYSEPEDICVHYVDYLIRKTRNETDLFKDKHDCQSCDGRDINCTKYAVTKK